MGVAHVQQNTINTGKLQQDNLLRCTCEPRIQVLCKFAASRFTLRFISLSGRRHYSTLRICALLEERERERERERESRRLPLPAVSLQFYCEFNANPLASLQRAWELHWGKKQFTCTVASWQGRVNSPSTPPQILACQKFSSKNTEFGAEKSGTLGDLGAKLQFWASIISSVGKLLHPAPGLVSQPTTPLYNECCYRLSCSSWSDTNTTMLMMHPTATIGYR